MPDEIEKKFNKLRGEYQTEEDQIRLAAWEKSMRVHVLTSKLKENDAFKLLIARYEKERQKLYKSLTENDFLFKDQDGFILGRLIHARIGFINNFFKVFSIADMQATGILNQVDAALAKE